MRLLLIEDEPKTVAYLKKGLTENGFVVDIAMDGEEGQFLAVQQAYDLIILDVMLPKVDGWTLITNLRRQNIDTPVLFLTAKDSVQERVKGLELGADDYLIKPFAFSELLARIRTILRRGQTSSIEKLVVSDLEMDPDATSSHSRWPTSGFDAQGIRITIVIAASERPGYFSHCHC